MGRANILKALLAASEEFETIEKNKTGFAKGRNFKYADLESVYKATKGALRKHGVLAISGIETQEMCDIFFMEFHFIDTEVHDDCIRATMKIDTTSLKPTEIGERITYFTRYLYSSMLGLVSEEETEGDDLNKSEAKSPYIGTPQVKYLEKMIEASGARVVDVCKYYDIAALDKLLTEKYTGCISQLRGAVDGRKNVQD